MERVSAADLAEASFDGVGGSHRLAFGEVVAQTGDGGGIGLAPALGEAAGGLTAACVHADVFNLRTERAARSEARMELGMDHKVGARGERSGVRVS